MDNLASGHGNIEFRHEGNNLIIREAGSEDIYEFEVFSSADKATGNAGLNALESQMHHLSPGEKQELLDGLKNGVCLLKVDPSGVAKVEIGTFSQPFDEVRTERFNKTLETIRDADQAAKKTLDQGLQAAGLRVTWNKMGAPPMTASQRKAASLMGEGQELGKSASIVGQSGAARGEQQFVEVVARHGRTVPAQVDQLEEAPPVLIKLAERVVPQSAEEGIKKEIENLQNKRNSNTVELSEIKRELQVAQELLAGFQGIVQQEGQSPASTIFEPAELTKGKKPSPPKTPHPAEKAVLEESRQQVHNMLKEGFKEKDVKQLVTMLQADDKMCTEKILTTDKELGRLQGELKAKQIEARIAVLEEKGRHYSNNEKTMPRIFKNDEKCVELKNRLSIQPIQDNIRFLSMKKNLLNARDPNAAERIVQIDKELARLEGVLAEKKRKVEHDPITQAVNTCKKLEARIAVLNSRKIEMEVEGEESNDAAIETMKQELKTLRNTLKTTRIDVHLNLLHQEMNRLKDNPTEGERLVKIVEEIGYWILAGKNQSSKTVEAL